MDFLPKIDGGYFRGGGLTTFRLGTGTTLGESAWGYHQISPIFSISYDHVEWPQSRVWTGWC